MSNPKQFRYEWIWEKNKGTNFAMANKCPLKAHESVLVFAKMQTAYNPQKTQDAGNRVRCIARKSQYGDGVYGSIRYASGQYDQTRFPKSVQYFPSCPRNNQFVSCYNIHPTQKPVALIEYLIKTYTNEGETVLDSTFGSGTTAIACLNTGRKFIGIERDPTYFAAAVARIEAHIAKRAEQLFTLEAA